MDKITGLYSYYDYDKDGNKVRKFCYTYEDEFGNVKYGYAADEKEAQGLMFDLLKSRGYTPKDAQKIMQEKDIFNLNCKDKEEVFERMKKANKNIKLDYSDFEKAEDLDDDLEDEEEKTSIFNRIVNGGKNLGYKVKGLPKTLSHKFMDLPLGKKIAVTTGCVLLIAATAWGALSLNRSKSPTATGSKVASTVDNEKPKIDEKPEETKEETTTATNTEQNTTSNGSTRKTYRSSGGSSDAVTRTPGSVDSSQPGFQDPNKKLDDSTNGSDSSSGGSETPEDPYDNVSESEEDNNYQEGENPDDDYSEEIDVPAEGNDQTEDKEDIDFDDKYDGNEGAIDFEDDPSMDNSGEDYADSNSPLPDQDETAKGDYDTTEEELKEETTNSNDNQTNKDEQASDTTNNQNNEEVPVYQTPNTTTTNTTSPTTTDLETAATQAVEAMANGQEGNIVVHTDGSISFEQSSNTAVNNMEATSMTK